MRQWIIAVLSSLVLAGCATHTALYGNFVENPAGLDQQAIAQDVVEKIVELYPPAKTRFELRQPTPDAFGAALIRGLRDQGYALLEFDPKATTSPVPTGSGLPFRYVFDQFIDTNMYRVTLMIGQHSLTRPYLQDNGDTLPAGYWVRKE